MLRQSGARVLDALDELVRREPAELGGVLLPGGELRIKYLREVDVVSRGLVTLAIWIPS